MNIPVVLRDDFRLNESMARTEWRKGMVIGATRAADDRTYAIVITEHGEFDLVAWYGIIPTIPHEGKD